MAKLTTIAYDGGITHPRHCTIEGETFQDEKQQFIKFLSAEHNSSEVKYYYTVSLRMFLFLKFNNMITNWIYRTKGKDNEKVVFYKLNMLGIFFFKYDFMIDVNMPEAPYVIQRRFD